MPHAVHDARSGSRVGERWAWAALLTLALFAPACGADADRSVAAVWKERELRFTYRGFNTVYPCALLERRIALVLTALGARPDLDVSVVDCDSPLAAGAVGGLDAAGWPQSPGADGISGAGLPGDTSRARSLSERRRLRPMEPRQDVQIHVRLSSPAEMTPETAADLEADRRRRELIAQVTGDPRPLFEGAGPFAAERQVLTLSRETIGLSPDDCELLDQMVANVFRDLGMRVVRRGYVCDRGQRSRIPLTLEVEALVPVGFRLGPARPSAPREAGGEGAPAGPPEDSSAPGGERAGVQ